MNSPIEKNAACGKYDQWKSLGNQGGLHMGIRRDRYLDRLIARMHNGMVKVITGIRRYGKTHLLFNLFGDYLRSGVGRPCASSTRGMAASVSWWSWARQSVRSSKRTAMAMRRKPGLSMTARGSTMTDSESCSSRSTGSPRRLHAPAGHQTASESEAYLLAPQHVVRHRETHHVGR